MRHSRLIPATWSYALCHFVVDLACVSVVLGRVAPCFGLVSAQARVLSILLYDLVAFCFQLPLGALLDLLGHDRARSATLLSFALVGAGIPCACLLTVSACAVALLLVALGNALFHCAGGVEVLDASEGRAAPSGVFICTGAVGVFVGGLGWFNGWWFIPLVLEAMLVGCAWIMMQVVLPRDVGRMSVALGPMAWVAVALLMATVALRSYTGMVAAFPWKGGALLAVCSLLAVVSGKAVGGFAADAWGRAIASLASLAGAALLFVPGWTNPLAGLAATFLFNFTMAITLQTLGELLWQAHGLAFGMASFALALGAVPALMGLHVVSGEGLATLALVSLATLELGILFVYLDRRA